MISTRLIFIYIPSVILGIHRLWDSDPPAPLGTHGLLQSPPCWHHGDAPSKQCLPVQADGRAGLGCSMVSGCYQDKAYFLAWIPHLCFRLLVANRRRVFVCALHQSCVCSPPMGASVLDEQRPQLKGDLLAGGNSTRVH